MKKATPGRSAPHTVSFSLDDLPASVFNVSWIAKEDFLLMCERVMDMQRQMAEQQAETKPEPTMVRVPVKASSLCAEDQAILDAAWLRAERDWHRQSDYRNWLVGLKMLYKKYRRSYVRLAILDLYKVEDGWMLKNYSCWSIQRQCKCHRDIYVHSSTVPIYLRKWLHQCYAREVETVKSNELDRKARFALTLKNEIRTRIKR